MTKECRVNGRSVTRNRIAETLDLALGRQESWAPWARDVLAQYLDGAWVEGRLVSRAIRWLEEAPAAEAAE